MKEAGLGICVDAAEQLKVHWFSQEGRPCARDWGESFRRKQDYAQCLSLREVEGWITRCGGLVTKSWHGAQPPRSLKAGD